MPIDKLTKDEGRQLLRKIGVYGETRDIDDICQRFEYHVMSLAIVAHYLVDAYDGDIKAAEWLKTVPESGTTAEKLYRALQEYWSVLTDNQRYFLTRLSIYPSAVTDAAFEVLIRPKSEGGPDNADDPNWRGEILRLVDRYLLQVSRRERDRERLYSIHPLIRDFFYQKLKEPERLYALDRWIHYTQAEWKRYTEGLPLRESPRSLEDFRPNLDLAHLCIERGLYEEAFNAYSDRDMDETIYNWGEFALEMSILEPLADAFQQIPRKWLPDTETQGLILYWLGRLCRKQGDTDRSMSAYRKGTNVVLDRSQRANLWLYLSYVLFDKGSFEEAVDAINKAESLGGISRGRILGHRGRCLGQLGKTERALAEMCEGISVSLSGDERHACTTMRQRGDLYFRLKRLDKALEDINSSLQIAEKPGTGWPDRAAQARKSLGDYYRLKGDFTRAAKQYAQALGTAERQYYTYLEAETHVSLARMAESQGDKKYWRDHAERAVQITERCKYQSVAAQAHLILARLARFEGDKVKAEKYADTARELIRLTKSYWDKQELKDLEKSS